MASRRMQMTLAYRNAMAANSQRWHLCIFDVLVGGQVTWTEAGRPVDAPSTIGRLQTKYPGAEVRRTDWAAPTDPDARFDLYRVQHAS